MVHNSIARYPGRNLIRWALVWSLVLASSAHAAVVVSTDSPIGWLGTGTLPGAGWNTSLVFDDSLWTTPGTGLFFPSFDGLPFGTIWWNATQTGSDGWFRREFTLSGPLNTPDLDAFFDDDGELYVNGTLVFDDKSGSADNALVDFNVAPYLVVGNNLIAFHSYDTAGGFRYGGVRLEAVVPEASSYLCWGGLTLIAGAVYWWRKSG